MPTSPTTTRHATLPSLPVGQSQAIRLRAVLKRALQEAMAVGLGLGIGVSAFACGSDALEPPDVGTGGVSGKGGAGGQGGGGQGGQGAGGQGGQGAGGQGGQGAGGQGQPKPLSICEAAAPGLGCDPQKVVPDFAHFNPPQNVSYWATGQGSTIKLEHGRSCATSPEPEACQKEIQEAISRSVRPPVTPCTDFMCDLGETFMLAKGEKGITVIKTAQAMAQFLAPIDTVAEAAAVAQYFSSSVLQCNDKRSGVQCEGDSFTIVAFESSCGLDDVWVKVKVPHSGAAPTREELQRSRNLCAIGRLPDGCESDRPAQSSWLTLADFWSECAGLEAASVPAFHMLAEDLRSLDAPAHLIDEAVSSADDEIVHAALILALARQEGAQSQEVSVPSRQPKSLFAMAHENAVEGCVRETFGAFVAAYQAQNASNPQTKAILTRIAEDEMRHAALSHAIAAWAEPQLSETARAQIADDRRQLIHHLRQSTAVQHAPEIYQEAGYPQAVAALRMLDVLQDTIWS